MIMLAALLPLHLTQLRLFHAIVIQSEKRYQNQIMLDALSAEVKQAGNTGCTTEHHLLPVMGYDSYQLTPDDRLIVKPTEIIVRHAGSQHAALAKSYDKGLDLIIDNALSIALDEVLIISDCHHAEIFKVAQVSKREGFQHLLLALPLHRHFDQGAVISTFEVNRFILINDSLYFENIHHSKTKLVDAPPFLHFSLIKAEEGLSQLHITFKKGYYHVTLIT